MNKRNFPMKFQGNKNKKKYFEGWYYKLVCKNKLNSIAFIPGLSLNKDDSHAFIQVFITNHLSNDLQTTYIRYDLDEFIFDDSNNILSLGHCKFGLDDICIDISTDDLKVNGQVKLSNRVDIQRNIFSPSIMGFFRYIPNMECYHGVVSMTHDLSGSLEVNQQKIDFNDGKGYIEKDWGTSFPNEYVWIQSNHFSDPDTSFMFSYATIPFLGLKFKGFIINLLIKNVEYRFATYNFSKVVSVDADSNKVTFVIKKGKYKLHVFAKNKETIHLASPNMGIMKDKIKEGLSGIVTITLYKRGKLIYQDTGKQSGLEIMLNLDG